MASFRCKYALVVLLAVTCICTSGQEESSDEPSIRTACDKYKTDGCSITQFFQSFVGPRQPECDPLYKQNAFISWLTAMGTDNAQLAQHESLFNKISSRLLEMTDMDKKTAERQQGSTASGATECNPNPKGKAEVLNHGDLGVSLNADSECEDLKDECPKLVRDSPDFCTQLESQEMCPKSCGYCGDVCMDRMKDCAAGAAKGACSVQRFKDDCAKACGSCGSVCDLPICENPTSLNEAQLGCWKMADNLGEQGDEIWKSTMRNCARDATEAANTAKASVIGNRIRQFDNTWNCKQIAVGDSLGYVCSAQSKDASSNLTNVICKGMHYSQQVQSCRRELTTNKSKKYILDVNIQGMVRNRIIAKQLSCGTAEVFETSGSENCADRSDGCPKAIADNPGLCKDPVTRTNKCPKSCGFCEDRCQDKVGKDQGESLGDSVMAIVSTPESHQVQYCNVTKALACSRLKCEQQDCEGECQAELMHF